MEPISLGIGLVGLGTSLYGMFGSSSVAHQTAQLSSNITSLEGQENDVRQQAMNMSAKRSQIQTVRTAQRARSMAVQAGATQTGSLTGSGVEGGISETTSEGTYGLQGINFQKAFGTSLFGLDAQVTNDKMKLASLGGTAATDAGITSLGGAIMSVAGKAGNIFGGQSTSPGVGIYSDPNNGAPPTWGN